MNRAWLVAATGAVAVALSWAPALAQGCAMCGTAVQDPNDPLARSLATSVYFMLSMPLVLASTVGGWLLLRSRRMRARRPPGGDSPKETQD